MTDAPSPNIERLKEIADEMTPAALIQAPEFTAYLFEHSPDAIVIVDRNANVRLMNRQAEIMFGWHRNEVAGKAVETLIPPGDREQHREHVRGYFREPRLRPMGLRIGKLEAQDRWGNVFTVEINLSPIQTMQGLFVIATVRRRDGPSG